MSSGSRQRLRALVIAAASSAGALSTTEARADGSYLSGGYIFSAVGGTTGAVGHGAELSWMYYESSRDMVGVGGFAQAQHYSGEPGHGRYALGLQAGGLLGAELGFAYRSGNGEHANTMGVHVGPYASIGFLYAGLRFTMPTSHDSTAPGYGYEAALTLGVKLPYPFGNPPPNLNMAHGRPLALGGGGVRRAGRAGRRLGVDDWGEADAWGVRCWTPRVRLSCRAMTSTPPFDRRTFVVSTLSTGFALAVSPAAAEAVATDTGGLVAGEVKIPVGDGEVPAYRAMPANAKKPLSVVLVVQEIFGVHEHIRDVCRRLAKLGYLAIAPELFARQGDVSQIKDVKEIIEKVVAKVPDAQVISDLDATLAWAGKNGGDVSRAAITGFCWGGRITWLYAAHNPWLRAGVAWYGRLVGKPDDLHPKHPIDVATNLQVSVLGLYGGADEGIPQDTVDKMKAALPRRAPHSEIVVFPDAPHAFFADYRPSYRKAAAEEGWKRLLGWLNDHGVTGK